jgi:hypothetical protein
MANPRNKKNIMSFNAGELSPKLDARVDTEKYAAGCRQCQNMIPMPHGGVTRRKGFEFVAAAKYDASNKPVRLLDFQFSRTVSFMLEFGDLYIRFYYLGEQIKVLGVPYEVVTTYTAAQCAEIQYVQINDVVYITHPSHPVKKLSRLANDNWTLVSVDFDRPPFLAENLTAVTIDPSGTTGTITLTSSAALFEAGHVGAYLNIGHRRDATSTELAITSVSSSAAVLVSGKWFFKTYGIWTATVVVERSLDGTTNWESVRAYTGRKDRNIDVEGEEDEEAYYRINITSWTSQTATNGEDSRAVFELEDRFIYGVVQVTAFGSSTSVTATVKRNLFSHDATQYWAEGAWSGVRGYPAACAFYENRMFFAGTTFQPQTLWASIVDDYENFTTGTADDDSLAFTLSSTERQQVLWMISQSRLVIGTTSGEWTAQGGDLENPITPTKIKVKQQSNFGSQQGRALLVNDTILFVQRSGRKLREAVYDAIREGYQSNDVTILSEHITAGGITSPSYQSDRDSIFWAVANGNLIGMTYEKEQSVIAWHRHTTAGTVESVETVYGELDDEVWVSVLRTIDGVQKRYLERMTGYFTPTTDIFDDVVEGIYTFAGADVAKNFLDSSVVYYGAPTLVVDGLDHLEGETVDILTDGAVHPQKVVSGGEVTLDYLSSIVHVGLAYDSIIQPMRLDVDEAAGNTQGVVKNIRGVTLRLLDTLGLKVTDLNGETFREVEFRTTEDLMDAAPPLFTGDKYQEVDGDYSEDATIILKQDQPLPWTLLGMVVHYQITGTQ